MGEHDSELRSRSFQRLKADRGVHGVRNKPGVEVPHLLLLAVLLPDLRPCGRSYGGRFATSDLNDLYRRVHQPQQASCAPGLLELKRAGIIVRTKKPCWQGAVYALLDRPPRPCDHGHHSARSNHWPTLSMASRPVPSEPSSKRVDYSGRSVSWWARPGVCTSADCREMARKCSIPSSSSSCSCAAKASTIQAAKRLVEREDRMCGTILERGARPSGALESRADLAPARHPCVSSPY